MPDASFHYCLRDQPGVAEVEADYRRVYPDGLPEVDEDDDEVEFTPAQAALDALIDRVSVALFDIDYQDTFVHFSDFLTGPGYEEAFRLREQHFGFTGFDFEVQRPIWDAMGIDVSDGAGVPLACLEQFERQLICARKEICGYLRSRADALETLESFEEATSDSAEDWGAQLLKSRRP